MSHPHSATFKTLVLSLATVSAAVLRADLASSELLPGPADQAAAGAGLYHLRITSDASPDLTDLPSLIYSTTSGFATPAQKVWSLFYWTHILRRQTDPMVLHGFEVTDPIRNFVDYGFTMCSTVAGINQSLHEALGLRHQFWDICNHSVSAVEYDGAFHMIDNSMSNLVTRDDGRTLATVTEAAADNARLVRERSLYATSPNGFLTGSDAMRSLPDFQDLSGNVVRGYASTFCADKLKYRDYYYNWSSGHEYVLNVRDDESYTRYYRRLGETPEYWVGSENVGRSDPLHTFQIDEKNRFGLRGNGIWTFSPGLTVDTYASAAYSLTNIAAAPSGGLQPSVAGPSAAVIYKVQAANAIASQRIHAEFVRPDAGATAVIAVSVNHGTTWTTVGDTGVVTGTVTVDLTLRDEVSAAYETLVRITLTSPVGAQPIVLTSVRIDTVTQVNIKALPRLNLGANQVYVGQGDRSDTMVLWPDLRGDLWKRDVHSSSNIASQSVLVPAKYLAVVHPAVLNQDAHLTYQMQAPGNVTRMVYGGRLHNYSAGSRIDFLHSFDGGATWITSYSHTDVSAPYDVIHYETVTGIPHGVRTVLFRFVIHNTNPDASRASGLYQARMQVNHEPAASAAKALDVTLRWKEVQADRTLVERSHRQRVDRFPMVYTVNVGGVDHPVMESLRVNLEDPSDSSPAGYSDGVDVGGKKYAYATQSVGPNLAEGKPYTYSRAPSGFQSSAPAENSTILTDGIVGPPAGGSFAYWFGQCWSANTDVDLQLDLGVMRPVTSFRAHLFGYPLWDALKGQVLDRIEVLTSADGITFVSRGFLQTSLWKKDIPVNHMLQDDETATAWNFERTLPSAVSVRYVRYHITPKRILCASELQVLERNEYTPFDMRIALPTTSSSTVQVPEVVGATLADAVAAITHAGLTSAQVTTASSLTVAQGLVMAQSPAAGSVVAISSAVALVVSSGPPAVASGEDVVLYAARDARVSGGWNVVADPTAAGGARLHNPNLFAPKVTIPLAAPTLAFDVSFTATAGVPYRLWIRGRADDDDYTNDSVYVQFDGAVTAAGTAAWRIGTVSATSVILEECSGCGVRGWGWADNGYGVPGTAVQFATSGPQRMRIQAREDGISIDQIILSPATFLTNAPGAVKGDTTIIPQPAPPASTDSNVVLNLAAVARILGGWSVVADVTASGGARVHNANLAAPKLTTPLPAPTLAFDVSFTATAGIPYRIWMRAKADGDSYLNDSVYVQFDGAVTSSGAPIWRIDSTSATSLVLEACSGCGVQGWGWADNGYGMAGPLVYFATTGPQRLRIQAREDGISIDQIVISPTTYLTNAPGLPKNDTTIVQRR